MDNIKKIIKMLNEIDEDWKNYFDTLLEEEDYDIADEIAKLLNELYMEIRIVMRMRIDSGRKEIFSEMENDLNKIIKDEELVKKMLENIKVSMIGYIALTPLRKWEAVNIEFTKCKIQMLFDSCVERIDNNLIHDYKKYDIDNQDEFARLLETFKSLAYFYVKNHYNRKAIMMDFKEEAGVSLEIAEFYSMEIDRRYDRLLLTNISDMLQELQGNKE